ncbi:MAG: hypothetical protein K0S93_5 [Nitrososphaeraceae archaeon]|jgi:hypothetical protein|nr:hypothetical protein [Nitrososphaeraceae archaeon]
MKDKDIFITDDKELVREYIFGGTKEKAIEMCKLISQYNIYDGFSGFGLYLYEARKDNPKIAQEVADKLTKLLDGQKEETHHVWIVLQEVMKWMAGEASEEFKQKVESKEIT